MMERRAHWSDELITAVLDAAPVTFTTLDDLLAVIAVVEDWHEKFVMHGAFRVLAERAANADRRALTAEAAIQRVRDLHGLMVTFPPDVDIDSYRRGMYDAYLLMVRALDGAE